VSEGSNVKISLNKQLVMKRNEELEAETLEPESDGEHKMFQETFPHHGIEVSLLQDFGKP
jgi:hypothetical protein